MANFVEIAVRSDANNIVGLAIVIPDIPYDLFHCALLYRYTSSVSA